MNINFVYDPSVANAPSGFKTALQTAANQMDSLIHNDITVNVTVGWGEDSSGRMVSGTDLSGGGSDGSYLQYSQVVTDLTKYATSIDDLSSLKSLPATDPTSGGGFWVSYSLQKAWGLLSPTATETDGSIAFSDTVPFTYAARAASGEYDFVGAAEQEIAHALDKGASDLSNAPGTDNPTDLFRYTAPGTLATSLTQAAYFSVDDGVTNDGSLAPIGDGDASEWDPASILGDAFGTFQEGKAEVLTARDSQILDVMGYNVGAAKPSPPVITGSPFNGTVPYGTTIHPFANVKVTDADPNAVLSASIDALGATITGTGLQGTDGSAHVTEYEISNVSAAQLTTDLQSIAYTSAPLSGANPQVGIGVDVSDGTSSVVISPTITPVAPSIVTPPTTGTTKPTTGTTSPPSSGTTTPPVTDNFNITDTTTGQANVSAGTAYTGPVAYLTSEYISPTQDSVNIGSKTPNAFIVTGSGNDAIDVSAGNGSNVISAGTGNNFLTGGTGQDTFFVDERSTTAVWDTINGFHAGDGVTIWGMTPAQIFQWQDGQGATGYTGLTFHTPEVAGPYASLTLVGYSQADLTSGKLSETFGTDSSGNNYLYIQGH